MEENKLKTGTTTVGIRCKAGVVLATESKSTMGNLIAGKSVDKVYKIDDKMGMTIAGGVGDAQNIIRILRAEISIYKLTRNSNMTVNGVATLLSTIQQNARYYPFMLMPIIGGYDKKGFHIISVDMAGGAEEDDKFISTGSGSVFAYGVLEDRYTDDITVDQGIEIAIRAISAAKERDAFSGGELIHVMVIDENKAEFLKDKEVKEMVSKL